MKLVENKNALVTGGGRGIGKAVALELAKNGANVAVTARSEDQLNEVATEIENFGVNGLAIPSDLSTIKGVDACADFFLEKFGTCDILVNNAGFSQYCPILEYPAEDFQYLLNLNVISYFQMTKRMLPSMIDQKGGKIILTSSASGNLAFAAKKFAYAASKVAVSAMGRSMDAELNPYNIHVNVVCPGPVETRLLQENREWGAIYPEGEPPEAISPLYLFLASNTIKRPYKGRVIDEYSLSKVISGIKEENFKPDFNIKDYLKLKKLKLSKDTYSLLRKNQELVEFMIKY